MRTRGAPECFPPVLQVGFHFLDIPYNQGGEVLNYNIAIKIPEGVANQSGYPVIQYTYRRERYYINTGT